MRWLITLSAQASDVERLSAEAIEGLSADPNDPKQLLFELADPEGDAIGEGAAQAIKPELEAFVDRVNGAGRLRWGRTFEGVAIAAIKSINENDQQTQHVFLEPAYDHMLPEDFADMVERLGHKRPSMPKGIDIINELDIAGSISLATTQPEVMRAVHLVDLMLHGDDEIDWTAGYAALEIVEHDLQARELDGQELGWWTSPDRSSSARE